MPYGTAGDEQRRAAERAALMYQLARLAGNGRPSRAAPWGLDRIPYAHKLAPIGTPTDLKLPQDAPEEFERALAEPRAPAARRASGIQRQPQRMGWGWRTQNAAVFPLVTCASTPAIPWPFRITQFTMAQLNTADTDYIVQLFLTDQAFAPSINALGGWEALLPLIQANPTNQNRDWGWQFGTGGLGVIGSMMSLATGTLGRNVNAAGKHVTIAVAGVTSQNAFASGTIGVEEIIEGDGEAGSVVMPRIVTPRKTAAPKAAGPATTSSTEPLTSTAPMLPRIRDGVDPVKDRAQRGGLPEPAPVITRPAKAPAAQPPGGGINMPATGMTPRARAVPKPAPTQTTYQPTGRENKPFYR